MSMTSLIDIAKNSEINSEIIREIEEAAVALCQEYDVKGYNADVVRIAMLYGAKIGIQTISKEL